MTNGNNRKAKMNLCPFFSQNKQNAKSYLRANQSTINAACVRLQLFSNPTLSKDLNNETHSSSISTNLEKTILQQAIQCN